MFVEEYGTVSMNLAEALRQLKNRVEQLELEKVVIESEAEQHKRMAELWESTALPAERHVELLTDQILVLEQQPPQQFHTPQEEEVKPPRWRQHHRPRRGKGRSWKGLRAEPGYRKGLLRTRSGPVRRMIGWWTGSATSRRGPGGGRHPEEKEGRPGCRRGQGRDRHRRRQERVAGRRRALEEGRESRKVPTRRRIGGGEGAAERERPGHSVAAAGG